MGQSTNGQIGFGVVFDEGYEFPWGDEDIENWWARECGFKTSYDIYDENTATGYKNDICPDEAMTEAHYKEKRAFKDAHPCPVKMENYCSADYGIYMLIVPPTEMHCWRGSPTEFDPTKLVVTEEQKKALLDFCTKYDLKFESGPAWYLTSYWG